MLLEVTLLSRMEACTNLNSGLQLFVVVRTRADHLFTGNTFCGTEVKRISRPRKDGDVNRANSWMLGPSGTQIPCLNRTFSRQKHTMCREFFDVLIYWLLTWWNTATKHQGTSNYHFDFNRPKFCASPVVPQANWLILLSFSSLIQANRL